MISSHSSFPFHKWGPWGSQILINTPKVTRLLKSGSCGLTPVQGLSLLASQLVRGIHMEVWRLVDWILLEYLLFTNKHPVNGNECDVYLRIVSSGKLLLISCVCLGPEPYWTRTNILINADVIRNKQINNPWNKPINLISWTEVNIVSFLIFHKCFSQL